EPGEAAERVLRPEGGGAADAAADVEEMHARREAELRRELDRRLPTAGMKFIDRRQVIRNEVRRILAGAHEGVEDRRLQRTSRVMLRDLLLDAHGALLPEAACKGAQPSRSVEPAPAPIVPIGGAANDEDGDGS